MSYLKMDSLSEIEKNSAHTLFCAGLYVIEV